MCFGSPTQYCHLASFGTVIIIAFDDGIVVAIMIGEGIIRIVGRRSRYCSHFSGNPGRNVRVVRATVVIMKLIWSRRMVVVIIGRRVIRMRMVFIIGQFETIIQFMKLFIIITKLGRVASFFVLLLMMMMMVRMIIMIVLLLLLTMMMMITTTRRW